MNHSEDFYSELHAAEATYGGGTYHMPSLLRTAALRRWVGRVGQRPLRLADVGCGKGLFMRAFTSALRGRWNLTPGRVAGVDLVRSPGDVFGEISDKFEFFQVNLDEQPLPFPDRSFDFLCCNHVLEHVFHTEKLVREFRRVLADDGLCIISVPNLAAWVNRVGLLFAGQPLGTELGTETITYGFWPGFLKPRLEAFRPSGHIRDFTPRGLRDLTTRCGFQTVGWWAQSHGLVARLSTWAGRNLGILLQPAGAPP
jgi:SAM-dependent methyltransferase